MKRGPFTGHFAYLSKTSSFGFPSKGTLPNHFIHPSKSPVYEPPPTYQVPLGWKGSPVERAARIRKTFLTYLPGSLVKELPMGPPPQSLFRERCYIHLSKSLLDEPSSRFPKRGPYGKSCLSP